MQSSVLPFAAATGSGGVHFRAAIVATWARHRCRRRSGPRLLHQIRHEVEMVGARRRRVRQLVVLREEFLIELDRNAVGAGGFPRADAGRRWRTAAARTASTTPARTGDRLRALWLEQFRI